MTLVPSLILNYSHANGVVLIYNMHDEIIQLVIFNKKMREKVFHYFYRVSLIDFTEFFHAKFLTIDSIRLPNWDELFKEFEITQAFFWDH